MWVLAHLRLSMYQAVLRSRSSDIPLASGFSYYREVDPPVSGFGGAKVTSIAGAALVATPPGWNAAFSRFGDDLSLLLTYASPAVPDDLARQYAEHIEEEMFQSR
jgi:hypothetical protein